MTQNRFRLRSLRHLAEVSFVILLALMPFLWARLYGLTPSRGPDISGLASVYPWLRWDSFHYLSIAQSGYQGVVCERFVCGNTGWFPLYPFLIRISHGLIPAIPIALVAQLVSILSYCIQILFWKRIFGNRWTYVAFAVALIILPGGVYQISAFPVSTALMFFSAALYLFTVRAHVFALISLTLSTLAYPSAVLFCLAGVPFVFCQLSIKHRRIIMPILLALSIFASAGIGYWFAQYIIETTSGVSSAYALTAARYELTPSLDFHVLRSSIRYFFKNPIFLQTAFVFLMLVASVALLIRKGLAMKPVYAGIILSSLLIWLPPHIYGDSISVYRQEALLQPLFLASAVHLPRPFLVGLTPPLVILSYLMFRMFISGELV